jgi:hypothetical protein
MELFLVLKGRKEEIKHENRGEEIEKKRVKKNGLTKPHWSSIVTPYCAKMMLLSR